MAEAPEIACIGWDVRRDTLGAMSAERFLTECLGPMLSSALGHADKIGMALRLCSVTLTEEHVRIDLLPDETERAKLAAYLEEQRAA